MKVSTFLVEARKFVVALTAAVSVIVANGLLADDVAKWVTGVLAAAGALLVYYVPNGGSGGQDEGTDPSQGESDGLSAGGGTWDTQVTI